MKMKSLVSIIFLILIMIIMIGCGSDQKKPDDKIIKKQASKGEKLPEIIPYLDAVPSAIDGQGRATINPSGPFQAGSRVDFQIEFTVGEAGVMPGGFVMLQISPWWGWTQPQNINPDLEGFSEISSVIDNTFLRFEILSMNRLVVIPRRKQLKEGDKITFKYQKAAVDMFAESEELFMIFVDADADGHSACIKSPPKIKILAHQPSYLSVNSPSQVIPGQIIRISAAPLDRVGNWSIFPRDNYTFEVIRNDEIISKEKIKTLGQEEIIHFNYSIPAEGIYFFYVRGSQRLFGKSNVTFCQKSVPRLKLYFGDIHGHSRLSDGSGTPEEYYRFARMVSGLDIAALTDHSDFGLIPIKGTVWKRIKEAAKNAYQPGYFVTFLGFEWTNWNSGHRNVYYRDGDGPVFRSFDPQCDTPQELWKLISPYRAMTVAHHVGGGPVPIDWNIPPGKMEWLVEICSIHGSSEFFNCESCIYNPQKGHFVSDALLRGYRLGIIASGDTHDGHPGKRTINAPVTGIMGVYAPELTREAIWKAFENRLVYGTSGPKIILNFRVGDSPMGSEINWRVANGPIPIAIRAICCHDIDRIEIIRNGQPVFVEKGNGLFAQSLLEDSTLERGNWWYYARVIQKDGNMAWSSPIWVNIDK